jgi:hypothetical protein
MFTQLPTVKALVFRTIVIWPCIMQSRDKINQAGCMIKIWYISESRGAVGVHFVEEQYHENEIAYERYMYKKILISVGR